MTFVENGRPNPDTKEEILTVLILLAEMRFGREFTPDDISVARAFYDPVAEYFAAQQRDLAEVLDASQLDYAEGEALDLLAAQIGVSRLDAQPATTRLQFQHDTPVTRDYTVPAGTGAQTESSDSIKFRSDEATTLQYLDGFEDQDITEYSGDTGSFSTSSTQAHTGTYSLTSSASATIVDINTDIEVGARFHTRLYLNTGTTAGFLFGVSTLDDHYRVDIDEGGAIALSVTEGGTETAIDAEAPSIPDTEWLHVRVDWDHNGEFTIVVFDSSGNEQGRLEATEANPTFETGGIGFYNDGTGAVYFDEVSMSRASVDATADEAGAETNVGRDALTILSSSVPGVDTVTNPVAGENGRDEEEDDDFRERTKQELGDASASTLPSLISNLRGMEQTRSVTVIDNDANSADGDGRPGHSFEPIVDVDSEYYTDVADTIVDTKAVGDTSVGGYAGTSVTRTTELVNGQTKDITFSVPSQVLIRVDVALDKTSEYAGDEQVQDNIVQYIGGELNSGANVSGEIGAGDDVIYYQVLEAIMDVEGVRDVTYLRMGTSQPPAGESNVTIADSETANTEARPGVLGITSNDV